MDSVSNRVSFALLIGRANPFYAAVAQVEPVDLREWLTYYWGVDQSTNFIEELILPKEFLLE